MRDKQQPPDEGKTGGDEMKTTTKITEAKKFSNPHAALKASAKIRVNPQAGMVNDGVYVAYGEDMLIDGAETMTFLSI